jgi:hypothetical protein
VIEFVGEHLGSGRWVVSRIERLVVGRQRRIELAIVGIVAGIRSRLVVATMWLVVVTTTRMAGMALRRNLLSPIVFSCFKITFFSCINMF